MGEGEDVIVKLHGDEHIYHGRVLRPRKMEVELLEYNAINGTHCEPNFVADENSIESWGYCMTGQEKYIKELVECLNRLVHACEDQIDDYINMDDECQKAKSLIPNYTEEKIFND